MKKLFFPLLVTMLIAIFFAGSIRAADDQFVQRVITIKNGNRNGIMHTVQDLVAGTPVRVTTSDNDHVILSGPKDMVTGFEEVIKQLDIPAVAKKDVETTVFMITASTQVSAATALPPELDPVVKQLKSIFNYKGFHLMDSLVLRSRDGERGENSGVLQSAETLIAQSPPSYARTTYHFEFSHSNIDGDSTGRVIRFDGLRLNLKIPVATGTNQYTFIDAGIATNVDVPEGKKVVVGKTSGVEGPDNALILVISAKVVD